MNYGLEKMISAESYEKLRKKYWDVASWTIWSQPETLPKSNMGDLSVFEDSDLLQKLNEDNSFIINGTYLYLLAS